MVKRKMIAAILLSMGIALTLATPHSVMADTSPPVSASAEVIDDSGGDEAMLIDDNGSDASNNGDTGQNDSCDIADSGTDSQDISGQPASGGDESVISEPDSGSGESTPADPASGSGESTPTDPDSGDGESTPVDPESGGGESTPVDPDSGSGESTPVDPESGSGESTPTDPESGDGESTPTDPDSGDGESTPTDPGTGEGSDKDPAVSEETSDRDNESEAVKKPEADEKEDVEEKTAPAASVISRPGYVAGSGYRGLAAFRFTLVEKVYALPGGDYDLVVREGQSFLSRVVGIVPSDGMVYVLSEGERWVYVESGEVRGFVLRSSLKMGHEVDEIASQKGEEGFSPAVTCIAPSENKALFYTKTTARETSSLLMNLRTAIVNKSMEYLGNAYVWGGTSLTDGCDCSGFIQSLFKLFGIDLPRVSRDQALAGRPIALSDVLPGDLLFYETNGVVSHVLMAIGDGKAINAANSKSGIIISDIDPIRTVRACRVISDSETLQTTADGASYTQEELELIWAIVAQEDDTSYEGALGVISSAMNRADVNYGGYGTTAYAQLTADGQYCYSPQISDPSYWQRRLGGNVPEYVKEAVSDCLTQGIRNNSYMNFRSSNRTGSYVLIGSNWYF